MNRFLLLVVCLGVRVRGQDFDPRWPYSGVTNLRDGVDILASVREYPSQLHKCTASFIRPDVLLTTARCLVCLDKCELFVFPLTSHLLNQNYTVGMSYKVTFTAIHPDYERNPQMNDIGVIRLNATVPGATIFNLPVDYTDKSGIPVGTYSWQFSPNLQEYHLELKTGTTISNAMCSLLLNRYIGFRHICMHQTIPSTLGTFDQGAPLVQYDKGVGVMTGIYVKEEIPRNKKIEVYQSLYPLLPWIRLVTMDIPHPHKKFYPSPSDHQAPEDAEANAEDASEDSGEEEMRFSSDLADVPEDELLNRALPKLPGTESPESAVTSGNETREADTSDNPRNVKSSPDVPSGKTKKALH